jgi:hypothetical protein
MLNLFQHLMYSLGSAGLTAVPVLLTSTQVSDQIVITPPRPLLDQKGVGGTLLNSNVILTQNYLVATESFTPPFNGKNRFLYKLTAADRALSGLLQSIPFSEDKAALPTYCRGNNELKPAFTGSLLDMFKMLMDLLFRDSSFNRNVFCRERVIFE